jgi:hypothetical protein
MGTKFRDKIIANVIDKEDHPYNLGVSMQAHHLVSKKGMKISNFEIKLKKYGYEIDDIDNLVLIPNEPFDACHMNVQLHRSNHSALNNYSFNSQDDKTDDEHPLDYHQVVKKLINFLEPDISHICSLKTSPDKKTNLIQALVNDISDQVLTDINSFKLKLTSIALDFYKDSDIGCSNHNNIDKNREKELCKKRRSHNSELPTNYILKAGN